MLDLPTPNRNKNLAGLYVGNFDDLWVEAIWKNKQIPNFTLKARPTGRYFFGPDGLRLGRVASLALIVKLFCHGVPIPTINSVEKVIKVDI